jgi:hypothetical protein
VVTKLALAGAALVAGLVLLLAAALAPPRAKLPAFQGVSAVPYLDAGPHHFADPVDAALDVRVAAGAADADSVAVRLTVYPFRTLGPPTVTRYTDGGDRLLRYRFQLVCMETMCLSEGVSNLLLPDSLVRYRSGAGRVRSLLVSWPTLHIEPRDASIASTKWRTGLASLPDISTAAPPRLASLVLLLAAAVVLLLSLRVLRPFLGAAAGWARRDRRAALARALEQVRHAARHADVPERRRALDLLARALRGVRRAGEGGDASRLAWSRREPTGESMEALADEIEVAGAP